MEELIRAIAEGKAGEQPETVVAMLQTRISRLESGARRAVRAAAVFGQTFWRGGVAAILEVAANSEEVDSALAALADAELTQLHKDSRLMHEEEHSFRHALVCDAAYGLLTPEDRSTGHRLAGEFLSSSLDADAAVIAEHFERGGDLPRAASYYWRAAERCFQQCDYRGALRHVDRGSRCAPDEALFAQLSSVRSAIDFRNGRFSEAHAARAIAAMRVLRPGSVAWSRATVGAIATFMILQKPQKAVELFAQALTTEPEADGRAAYVDSISYLANWAATGAPIALVDALFLRLKTIVEVAAPELPGMQYYLHGTTAQVALYRQGRPFTAVVEGEASKHLAHEVGDTMAEFHMSCHIIELGWLEIGDRDGVVQRLRELRAQVFATQENGLGMLWRQLFARSLCAVADEGCWDEAIALTDPLLKIQNLSFFAKAIRARVALQRGQLPTAEALAREAMQAFPMLPYYLADIAVTFIRTLHALRRFAEAAAAAESTLAVLGSGGGLGPYEIELRLCCSEAFQAAGNIERAHNQLRETLRQMRIRRDDIADLDWKICYLTRNPHCVSAQRLAQQWQLSDT